MSPLGGTIRGMSDVDGARPMGEIADCGSDSHCVHWREPGMCNKPCARCGHECKRHYDNGRAECGVSGCDCPSVTGAVD